MSCRCLQIRNVVQAWSCHWRNCWLLLLARKYLACRPCCEKHNKWRTGWRQTSCFKMSGQSNCIEEFYWEITFATEPTIVAKKTKSALPQPLLMIHDIYSL